MSTIGRFVKTERKKLGLTQEDFAVNGRENKRIGFQKRKDKGNMKKQLVKTTPKKILSLLLAAILVLLPSLPVMAAEGSSEYIFGTSQEYSTYDTGSLLNDSFYYTDDWFSEDPAEANTALALLSMQLVASGVDLAEGSVVDTFLTELGFDTIGYVKSGSEDAMSCNYTYATKTLDTGGAPRTLAAVIIQSHTSDQPEKTNGWNQNFIVNGDISEGEHFGLSTAAYSVLGDIAALGDPGNTTFWIMGHSRGGAIANLLAAHLPEVNPSAAGNVYAYTFESPCTVDGAYLPDSGYEYIHNYICSDDVVTMIPPWGMARYGTDLLLNTEEADAELFENLRLLGSGAADEESSYNPESTILRNVLASLADTIPTREDYSAEHTDYVIDAFDNEVPISYVYQDTFVKLCTLVTSDALSDFPVSSLLDYPDALSPIIGTWIQGVRYDDPNDYWTAATMMKGFLDMAGLNIPLDSTDVYVLMKLFGPYLFNTELAPDTTDADIFSYLTCLNPDVYSLLGVKILMLSHNFDTVIARLKSLAPSPHMENIDIVIPEPAAGDDILAAPAAVEEDILNRNESWLTTVSSWNIADDPEAAALEDGMVYYLTITAQSVGHVAPDDFAMTLNGADPIQPLEMRYEDGTQFVTGIWKFAIGEPETVMISFDPVLGDEQPESVQVEKGEKLAYAITPPSLSDIEEPGIIYRHTGWIDAYSTPWNELTALTDIALTATRQGLINDISVLFEIPHAGETANAPTLPSGALYEVDNWYLLDSSYYDVEGPLEEQEYILSLHIAPAEGLTFLSQPDNYDSLDYSGSFTVNGESVSVHFDTDYNVLDIEYTFKVLPANAAYTCTSGDGSKWTKGSGVTADFTFSRSADDDTTFRHFTGIKVDDAAVAADQYLAAPGSVILNLSAAYLETLAVGEHTLTAEFDDGSADAVFTIVKNDGSGTDGSGTDDSGKDDSVKDDSGTDDSGTDSSGKDNSGKNGSGSDRSGSNGNSYSSSGSSNQRSTGSSGSQAATRTTIAPRQAAGTSGSKTTSAASSGKSTTSRATSAAHTADESNSLFWTVLAMLSGIILVSTTRKIYR